MYLVEEFVDGQLLHILTLSDNFNEILGPLELRNPVVLSSFLPWKVEHHLLYFSTVVDVSS